MLGSGLGLVLAILIASAGAARAEPQGDATESVKRGAAGYRVCSSCHSLQPGVHLSGPSLAGLWGQKAGSLEGYGRYTKALKAADVVWDADGLNAWLADPQALVPGTTMTLRGIADDQARADLIAFLRMAMAEGGVEPVVKAGLIAERTAAGQIPPNLSTLGADFRISAIRHCHDAYYIAMERGTELPIWETNVRIKVDTSRRGPKKGAPVLMRSGMAGDRVSVVFSSLSELKETLVESCGPRSGAETR